MTYKTSYKIFIVLSIIAMFALTGCTNNNNNGGGEMPPVFYGGTQGLVASFEQMGMAENDMEIVWVGKDFPVEVTLKNKGEENIAAGDAVVKIQGIDTNMFNIDNPVLSTTTDIEKVSEYNTYGGEETVDFGNARLDSVTGLFYDANFFASVEYEYKTHIAVPQVCFKSDYQSDELCNLNEAKQSFSSGAPIIATSVTQEPSGSKRLALIFNIENVGGGDVTPPGEEFSSLHNKFRFELVDGSSSDITWECTSSGDSEIGRFNDGIAKVRCRSSELPEGTLYTKQVTLQLAYRYRDVIQRTVRIRNEIS